MSHFSDAYMPISGADRQTNIRPPSKPFMGSRLSIARKKHATAKKIKHNDIVSGIEKWVYMYIAGMPQSIFDKGPDNDNSNSFLYEYIGNATPSLAPKRLSEKLLIFIFSINDIRICPSS